MTSLKTIAATAVIAVAGTVAAFSGLHLGQSPADAATAAQPAKAKASYTVTLTAKDLARLATMMNGQRTMATVRGTTHHKQPGASPAPDHPPRKLCLGRPQLHAQRQHLLAAQRDPLLRLRP